MKKAKVWKATERPCDGSNVVDVVDAKDYDLLYWRYAELLEIKDELKEQVITLEDQRDELYSELNAYRGLILAIKNSINNFEV
ncbi:hypothetical protein D3C85_517170 [compost metagenome]